MAKKTIILDSAGVQRALTRIAHEILEHNKGVEDVVLVGIRTGGDHLAAVLQNKIEAIEGAAIPLGALDISMYRDDISSRTDIAVGKTDIAFPLDGKKVILVDDVLYTGRTIRAAMGALMDLGRPENIQLAVLIDRGHRELPIRPDYIGRNVPTARDEKIEVVFDEDRFPVEVRLNKPQ
ncbi:MAG: bifunctional pyr operon transcriptional regulator/uracil phosphoribosyltransferase PyrR [Desulfuromonadales bacterium]|nr:bifunctional pyr operon transcriptional regulator/uracil phosphoribosyltransferase PyrR [Desulfuromonadales bacterium]NIS42898.1 bifunctional pyr operon transcriptional regulator/uracil phosphoribosyltransferase PyrR [Desulfuromonadales bacterium]